MWERAATRLAALDSEMATTCPSCRRWVEKTPKHVYYLRRLFLLRPRARIILVVREPKDAVASVKARNPRRGLSFALGRWRNDTQAMLPWLAHPSTLLVSYDALVTDTEKQLDRVFTFVGEKYNITDILAYSRNSLAYDGVARAPADAENDSSGPTLHEGRDHARLRAMQINQPLFDGRGRWREPPPRGLASEEVTLVTLQTEEIYEKVLQYAH